MIVEQLKQSILEFLINGKLLQCIENSETIERKYVKLKDLCYQNISYGIVKLGEEDNDNGVKVLRCSDVKKGYIDESSIRTVTKEMSNKYKRTILNGGEVLINVRGTLGGCSIVPNYMKGYNIAREVALIPLKKEYYNKYVMYCLMSPTFNSFMNTSLRGIAYKGLNINLLSDFEIPIMKYDITVKLVEFVDYLFSRLDEIKDLELELKYICDSFSNNMTKSILNSALSGCLTVNESSYEEWNEKNLENIADIYTGNSISENIKKTKYTDITDGYNYIGTKDINFDHSLNYENGIKIPFEEKGFKYAEAGSILMCIEGGSAGKKIGFLEEKVCFGNKLCNFNVIDENILPKFLYYFLQSPIFLKNFNDNISGIIGGVSINKIKKISIKFPSLKDQKQIIEKIEKLLPLCNDIDKLIKK